MDEITINEPMIQGEAENMLDRELSHEEYLDVIYLVAGDMYAVVQEAIHRMLEHNAMLLRNREAVKVFPHFVVSCRNTNTFQHEFNLSGIFKNAEDARAFTRHDPFLSEFEEWRIVQVEEDGTEKEIIKINC